MQAVLKDLGTADAIIARRLEDGTYQILDGHLRTGIADENELLPALLVDLNDDEAERFLLTHDPIAELAGTSSEALEALTTEIDLGDDLKSLTQYLQKLIDKTHDKPEPPKPDTTYGTVVRHKTENDQRMLYEELKTRGYDVTVSML